MSLPLNCLCMFLASPLSYSPFLPHPHPSFCQVCLQMPQTRNLPERGESSFHSSSILRGVYQGEADRPTAPQGSEPGWEVIYSQKAWKGITGDTARYLATLGKCSSHLRKKIALETVMWLWSQSLMEAPSPATGNILVGMEVWLVWEKMRTLSPISQISSSNTGFG